ncbi:hypothetical protein O3795_05795 [Haemophilus parahaemolyticus]|nr:hypothetical protein [Haemophilus parahaemolyticus]MDQ6575747.1 hypothetical protein [Haemophilus parahaemolyticus]
MRSANCGKNIIILMKVSKRSILQSILQTFFLTAKGKCLYDFNRKGI